MRLKLSECANRAEVIGAVATTMSLILVGIRIGDTTNATNSAATIAAATAMQSRYVTAGSDAPTAKNFYHGMPRPGSRK